MSTATAACEVVRPKKKRPGITGGADPVAVAACEDREVCGSANVPPDQEPEDPCRAVIPFEARVTTEEEPSPTKKSRKNRPAVTAACNPETSKKLEQLAQKIRESHAQVVGSYRTSVKHAVCTGQYLLRVKKLLKKEKRWGAWLKTQHFAFSDRTARAYVQAAESPEIVALLEDPDWQPAANSTLKGLLQKVGKSSGKPARKTSGSKARSADKTNSHSDGSTHEDGEHHDREEHTERADHRRAETSRADRSEHSTGKSDKGAEEPDKGRADDDEQWLKTLPIRTKLADPTSFDREALAWRRAQPLLMELNAIFEVTEDDHKMACLGTRYRKRLASMVAVATGVEPPSRWKICSMCKGRGCKSGFTTPCIECDGAGYRVTLQADRIVWNEETDDDE
jgi:hypothetical protein